MLSNVEEEGTRTIEEEEEELLIDVPLAYCQVDLSDKEGGDDEVADCTLVQKIV